MTTETDLLPLPEKKRLAVRYEHSFGSVTAYGYDDDTLRDYARANVARAVEPLQAEIDALRTRLEDTVRDSTNKIEALRAEVERYRALEAEAAQFVEVPIINRTKFTGDEPYVGWRGLGQSLNEALDERDALRAEVAEWKRVATAQARLHDEAEFRARRSEKMLSAYQAAVNKIDDLIEYSLPMPPETKAALYAVLANLTATLAKEITND